MKVSFKILDSVLLARLDKKPVEFRRVDEREVTRIVCAIGNALAPNGLNLAIPATRKAFLAACLKTTEHEAREHLVIGYGHVHGNTTRIARIHHVIGAERGVDVPPHIRSEIVRHYRRRTYAEVLIFHNHPRTGEEAALVSILKALVEDLPVASHEDRRTLQQYALNPLGILRHVTGGGRLRFFLGESGYVSEFTLPPLLMTMAEILNAASPHQARPG
jgi:hypothetical protein